MQADLDIYPLVDYPGEDGRKVEQQLQLSDKGSAGAQTLDIMGQGLPRQSGHDHEGSAEEVLIAFRHYHAGCGKAHFGESILDNGFQLHPRRIGVGMTEAQDQRPTKGGVTRSSVKPKIAASK